jgi:hypothetical protein
LVLRQSFVDSAPCNDYAFAIQSLACANDTLAKGIPMMLDE